MHQQRLEFGWRTDQGRVRAHNEDAVTVEPELGLVIVADGIGGASAGEVASRLAAHVIAERFRKRTDLPTERRDALQALREAVEDANRVVWDAAQRSPRYHGMGTTVVAGFVGSGWMVYAHVGDSRLYRLRGGQLVQLTRDHSLIQEVVDQGFFQSLEDAQRSGINGNILTRGLGTVKPVTVDVRDLDLDAGDLFLFCTDGLSNMVADEDIAEAIAVPGKSLDSIAEDLIARACAGGGLDNITAALMRVG